MEINKLIISKEVCCHVFLLQIRLKENATYIAACCIIYKSVDFKKISPGTVIQGNEYETLWGRIYRLYKTPKSCWPLKPFLFYFGGRGPRASGI